MTKQTVLFAILGVLFLLITQSVFIVDERKQAIVMQFGDPKRTVTDAGLHLKMPVLQQVEFYERRILDVDPPAERLLLSSKNSDFFKKAAGEEISASQAAVSGEPIMVDTFARYKIVDPLRFRQRLGTENAARNRLMKEINSATRDTLGQTTLSTLLSNRRQGLMNEIQSTVNEEMDDLGIEIVDIRIIRADLTTSLRASTVERMMSERQQQAREIRTNGEKEADIIRANARKERDILLANAREESQKLRGQGDGQSIDIYAEAFKKDPEFYGFYRSLEAYRSALGRSEARMILSPDSTFFDYLKNDNVNK